MGVIDLTKRVEKVGIILEKKGINNVVAQVKLAIDRSGSMDHLYSNGTVQDVVERVLGIGINVDVDKSIDAWAFHSGSFDTTNCYECKYKRDVPGHCHILCVKPDPNMIGDPYGIRNGWFIYPLLFDPIWKEKSCSNFEKVDV